MATTRNTARRAPGHIATDDFLSAIEAMLEAHLRAPFPAGYPPYGGPPPAPAIVRSAIEAWESERRAEQPDADPVMQVVMVASDAPEPILLVSHLSLK